MDLKHLKCFLAVAEELHFTRAAERLGIAQPPLSQQIKDLEIELGASLFFRTSRIVALTSAGRALLPHARAALRDADLGRAAVHSAICGEARCLRVGFTSAASFNPHVGSILCGFRQAHRSVEISLIELSTDLLLKEMNEGRVDVAFLRPCTQQREELTMFALPMEAMWVALPRNHSLCDEASVKLDRLAGDTIVMCPRSNGSWFYDSVMAIFLASGLSTAMIQEAPQMTTAVNLVAAGAGVAVVPESMRSMQPAGVVYVRIDTPGANIGLWVAHRRLLQVLAPIGIFMDFVARYFECDNNSVFGSRGVK
ncbi:LysR family transcriptional regulator [Pseudomonas sp. C32]|jgi:DNA-binding transcriptional LysR family regulator|uniref:LysR family transcriptional regulator n=1 Tax=Pseudomonas sp. C32 TaxID=1529208 RepID=UPI002638AE7E|nr:LysR family transcriptional regulator [Pseudomonas sp. C32]MDN4546991.1 LysR family transcriptional regulator [Pseudomonas sp. C32]